MQNSKQEASGKVLHAEVVERAGGRASKADRSSWKWLSMFLRLYLLLLFGLGFALSIVPQGRACVRAALILPALLSASETGPLLLSGEPIKHTQMIVPSGSEAVFLDIFTPTTRPPLLTQRGGILMIPGVGDNRQVPQLINLSESLARTGITVMDMTTPTLMNYDLSVQDSDAAVVAFKKLATLPGVSVQHIGIVSFSGGVLAATYAAADARIRDQVAYVTSFGGYFNTANLLRVFGSRSMRIDGMQEAWHPIPVPLQVIGNMLSTSLPLNEQELIKRVAGGNRKVLTAHEVAILSSPGQAAYHLLIGDQPGRVEANIAALPVSTRIALIDLSPARVIAQIRAPIFLLHDRNDDSIPVTESRDFAATLARLHHPYQYVEFHIFDHVLVRSHLNVGQMFGDGLHLFGVLQQIVLLSSS